MAGRSLWRVWPLLFIIVLAFSYRLVIMADRAAAPNELASWDPLPTGTDQSAYFARFLALQRGDFPPASFYYQPGIVYFLGFAGALLQTSDMVALRLFQAFLAALNCGLMAFFTWRATGSRTAGLASGLLLALYPVSAFYDTDFVITSQALVLATLLFGCVWLAHRSPRNLFWPLVTGLAAGAGAVTRFELVAPAFVCALWLLLLRRDARGLRQFLLVALGALLIIAPVALHNRQGGADYLITPTGPKELYRGNNRDTDGRRSPSNAYDSTHQDYLHWLLRDIALEPGRFMQLSLHKLALFLSSIEPGNNLDFNKSGRGISPVLAHNPLSFSILLILTLAGLLALWHEDQRPLAILLLAGAGTFLFMVLLVWVESRLKTPVVAWMMPAAGYAVARALTVMRNGSLPAVLRRNARLLAGSALLLLLIQAGATGLPRDVTVSGLPAAAVPAGLIYDDTLELVGWQVREQYSPRHTIQPFRPWVVSLYWRLLQETAVDYSFSLKMLIDDEEIIALDRPVGYIVFPRDFTSDMRVGPNHVEHVGLSYRRFDGSLERSGRIVLDVYPGRDFDAGFLPHNAVGEAQLRPVLAQPAILLEPGRNEVLVSGPEVAFGDALLLLGHELPQSGVAGERVRIRSAWRSGPRQIETSYIIGVYLFRDGEFVANQDSPPHDGALLTFSLTPDYHFDDEKWLTLPQTPGRHEAYIGVYDQHTMARLPLAGVANNLHHIGSIELS